MASGARDLASTFAARISILVTGLAAQSCMAWLLGPAGRGSYATCLIFTTILSMAFFLGTGLAGRYFVASKRFTVAEGVIHILACGLVSCSLAAVVGVAAMRLPLEFFTKASPDSFYLALACLPASLYATEYLKLLTFTRQFWWYGVLTAVSGVCHLALTLLFLWVLEWGVNGALFGLFINNVLLIAGALAVLHWKHGLSWAHPTWRGLRDMVGYGARHTVGQLSQEVNFQLGTILLAFFGSTEEVGVFAVASQFTGRSTMVPDALGEVMLPRVAGDAKGRADGVAQLSRLTTLVCGGGLLVLAVFATPIVTVLFSPSFLPMVPVVRILAIAYLIRCAGKGFEYYLLGTNHPGATSTAVAAAVVVNLGLLWYLMPRLGLVGAALAMTGSFVVQSAFVAWAFSRFSGKSQKEIWRFRRSDLDMLSRVVRSVRGRFSGSGDAA